MGAGYVGMSILTRWENQQDRFIVVTTTPEKISSLAKLPRVEEVILHDFTNALEKCDGLILTIAPKKGASYEETYLKTAQSIRKSLAHRNKPLYILYTSSTSVYGQQNASMIDETTPPSPQSHEGKILLETEETLLQCSTSTVKVCILRLGGIYGPGRDLASRAKRMAGREMPGSGDQATNHSHIEDICRAAMFGFDRQLAGIHNVVSDAHPNRDELYRDLCKSLSLPSPIWNPKLSQIHGCNSAVSNKKLKNAGFTFLHDELK